MEPNPRIGDVVHYVSYGTPGGEFPSVCRVHLTDESCDESVALVRPEDWSLVRSASPQQRRRGIVRNCHTFIGSRSVEEHQYVRVSKLHDAGHGPLVAPVVFIVDAYVVTKPQHERRHQRVDVLLGERKRVYIFTWHGQCHCHPVSLRQSVRFLVYATCSVNVLSAS